ncbi:hypothetical protein GCM10010218_09050 [Streptomyces mashuensis]|uniref:Carrier domain-containing protein n=1 Tax=Streptomyces mashuensis TaxID=33904 RepID=A0A919AWQ9_9ACTN|nr:acyl carrier protein [Streptomyces mashuensis]GHF30012.1 hypothetical protein GCM10010218_09050 [Streptomyces mashuensis]
MTAPTETLLQLRDLPGTELGEAVEELVTTEFRRALLMDDDEELPLHSNFFEIGLTSLRLMNVRRTLEETLGLPIDTTVLFSRPTVDELVQHLTDVLADGRGEP